MFKNQKYLYFILFWGIILRISIFYLNVPNNSYDDHLEVIDNYVSTNSRPSPEHCWECYQPPIYYFLASNVLKTSIFLFDDNYHGWKSVQFINCVLSILLLFVLVGILNQISVNYMAKCLILTFWVCLPRDLYTSAMIGNDYLLIFISGLCTYLFLKIQTDPKGLQFYLFLLVLLSLFGPWTKQSGLILIAFPIVSLFSISIPNFTNFHRIIIAILIVFLGISNEGWLFLKTGIWVASNQDFFRFAANQPPGNIELVEFGTFRIFSLFKSPFISDENLQSFLTELFARLFFDYENRFFNSNCKGIYIYGRLSFLLGLIWIGYFITKMAQNRYLIFNLLRRNMRFCFTIIIIVVGFLIIPLVQTLRFPYFSSMKAMFILPGLFPLMAFSCKIIEHNNSRWIMGALIILPLIWSLVHLFFLFLYLPQSLNEVSGPLWVIP